MLRKDVLIFKTRTLLDEFLAPMLGQVDKPRQRFLKQAVRAILFSGSLAVLAMLAMGFLTWILLRSRDLTKRLFSLTSRFRKNVKFQYYRLLDGIQEFIRLNPNDFVTPPLRTPRNG